MNGADVAAILKMDSRFREGGMEYSHPLTHVSIVAAATSTTLYQVTPNFTVLLIGIHVANRNASNALLTIGTGDFTQVLPTIGPIIAGFDDFIWLFPTDFENNDIVIQSDNAAASANEIEVMPYVLQLTGA